MKHKSIVDKTTSITAGIIALSKHKSIVNVAVFIVITFATLYIIIEFIVPLAFGAWFLLMYKPFTDKTAEELYSEYVLDEGLQPPSKFNAIEGLERTAFFVTMRGPVFIYFEYLLSRRFFLVAFDTLYTTYSMCHLTSLAAT